MRCAIETDKFLLDVNASETLATMRGVLSGAYESQLGRKEMERLEERLEKVKVWGEKGFRSRRRRR